VRCPKCHYISFEAADRCRNCGYDFSLTAPTPIDDPLPLQDRDQAPLPPMDLSLAQVEGLHDSTPLEREVTFDLERIAERVASFDLPLFGSDASDAPLVRPPAVPRAPLAVRRATPDVQRLRSRYSLAELPSFDLDAESTAVDEEVQPERGRMALAAPPVPAPAGRRLFAALVDVLIVSGINVGVLYFTLKLCELPLTPHGLLALPPVPLVVFLLMLDGGYIVTFTAVMGQTIGKMAVGLRVVHATDDEADMEVPNLGVAILRTAAYAASLLPAGLGFVPALFGRDRRALHDRLAETKVIKI
jgi:uncharacterized RDD family membrane protein YckC